MYVLCTYDVFVIQRLDPKYTSSGNSCNCVKEAFSRTTSAKEN